MPTTTIILIDRETNEPIENAKVCLGFTWGHSQNGWTDSNGEVDLDHSSTGEATLYINGRDCGTVMTPGVIKKYGRRR